jgi:L-threonylcarbamoyladenylate synthase
VTILTERISLASLAHSGKSAENLDKLVGRINQGAVFVYPTETIYGIGGRADSEDVEKRIRSIKGRHKVSPLILIAADVKHFNSLGLRFTRSARLLAEKFWPGNLTLIVQSTRTRDGVGIRISDHPFITALYTRLDVPLFSTSANISDTPYANDPDAIFNTFRGKVDFMIDAGVLPESMPSTVARIAEDDTVEILREGVVPAERVMQTVRQ